MRIHILAVATTLLGIACTIPVQAQTSPYHNGDPASPYHSGVVVPGVCPSDGFVNSSQWVTVGGHHALSITTSEAIGNSQVVFTGAAGFEIYGNVNSVLHGVLPSTGGGSGILPLGDLTFQIISNNDPANYMSWDIRNAGGNIYSSGQITNLKAGQTIHIPLTAASAGEGGVLPVYVPFFLDTTDDVVARVVVGGFAINGVPIHATTQVDERSSTAWEYCY